MGVRLHVIAISAILLVLGCSRQQNVSQEVAQQMIEHRTLGLAYLEEGSLSLAEEEFTALTEIAPAEPLGFGNLGLTYLRMGEFEQAEQQLLIGLDIAPNNPEIRLLLAKVYEMLNQENQAAEVLETSLESNPGHIHTLYQLAKYYQSATDENSAQRAEELYRSLVNEIPGNLTAQLQLVEILLRNGKAIPARDHMEQIRQLLPVLPEGSLEVYQRALDFMRQDNADAAFTPARIFHNLLKSTDFYQAAVIELEGIGGSVTGTPMYHFTLNVSAALASDGALPNHISFTDVSEDAGLGIDNGSGEDINATLATADYDGDGDQDIYVSRRETGAAEGETYLFEYADNTFREVSQSAGISHPGTDNDAAFVDYNNDGYLDLCTISDARIYLFQNDGDGTFTNITETANLSAAGAGSRFLFADFEPDGDLDIFVTGAEGTILYRNNLDGTFLDVTESAGISIAQESTTDAGFGDFDDDGDLDIFVSKRDGSGRLYSNQRQSYFQEIGQEAGLSAAGGSGDVTIFDYNNDGWLDILVSGSGESTVAIYRNLGDGSFQIAEQTNAVFDSVQALESIATLTLDYDNDGFQDLLISGDSQNVGDQQNGLFLFHNAHSGRFANGSDALPEAISKSAAIASMDYDNDGDEDLLTVTGDGSLHLWRNDGGNTKKYQNIALRGLLAGSSKNNYFGIGAKVEVKAGALYQMRVMNEPVEHFGLGLQDSANVVRVVWSNGVPQNNIGPEPNQSLVENQVLKGSCPWLYAWNGEEYEFVTDVLWASALGMPLGIMGGERDYAYAFSNSTDEYLKIPGSALQPKNGMYSLQFTDELWETPYVDQVKLLVVDHPADMEIYVDEEFVPPPFPEFRVYGVQKKQYPIAVSDERGNDLREDILEMDGRYISNLTPARYQGIMEMHDLVLDLGDIAQADSVYLFFQGWVFPTDASINVAMAQSEDQQSISPYLQVIDANGNWKTALPGLGFPKGKNKTMIIALDAQQLQYDTKIRLRTNMQIYWDHIFYATEVTDQPLRITTLNPREADLHYRGFSNVSRATPYSPHIPDYDEVSTEPQWRDLTGMYTRYGDVVELLQNSDSKYVIMNAGDEITMEFQADEAPNLAEGWTRDFVLYNDGWLKDGDLNTATGQTVEPLPFHGMSQYPYGPEESYPQDQEHQDYLRQYNTRKVETEQFRRMVMNSY